MQESQSQITKLIPGMAYIQECSLKHGDIVRNFSKIEETKSDEIDALMKKMGQFADNVEEGVQRIVGMLEEKADRDQKEAQEKQEKLRQEIQLKKKRDEEEKAKRKEEEKKREESSKINRDLIKQKESQQIQKGQQIKRNSQRQLRSKKALINFKPSKDEQLLQTKKKFQKTVDTNEIKTVQKNRKINHQNHQDLEITKEMIQTQCQKVNSIMANLSKWRSAQSVHKFKQISDLFRRNTNLTQIHLRMILEQKKGRQLFSKFMRRYVHFCTKCSTFVFSSTKLEQYYNQRHNAKHHPKYTKSSSKHISRIPPKDIINLYKQKIKQTGKQYYKCSCQRQSFSTLDQYIQHIKITHKNYPPEFSSHIWSQSQKQWTINPQFNQQCVLQEMMGDQIYYCGECDLIIIDRGDVYYEHIVNFHKGIVKHPYTSHFIQGLTTYQECYVERQNNKEFIQEDLQIECVQKLQNKQQQTGRLFSIKNTSFKRPFNSKNQLFQKSESEILVQKIISEYKGPYICSVCQIDFKSQKGISDHFNQSNSISKGHLKRQKNFLRIVFLRLSSKLFFETQSYFLPTNEHTQNLILNVPITDKKKQNIFYKKMTVKQLTKYSKQINNVYSSFRWHNFDESIQN